MIFFFFEIEPDKSYSKLIKFQKKKKKSKSGDQMFEYLRNPDIILAHDSSAISLNLSSIRFWDKLRLSPLCGEKNISYITIYPSNILASSVENWMYGLTTVWEFCGFGSFAPVQHVKGISNGIIPVLFQG